MPSLFDFDSSPVGNFTTLSDSSFYSMPLARSIGAPAEHRSGLDFVIRTPDGEITFEWIEVSPGRGRIGSPACLDIVDTLSEGSALVRAFNCLLQMRMGEMDIDSLLAMLTRLLMSAGQVRSPMLSASAERQPPAWARSSWFAEAA